MTSLDNGYQSDAARWAAVEQRDSAADGYFYLGVKTTGIYCVAGCPARTPKRENVLFFKSQDAALEAGFRVCKRCKPDRL